MNPPDSFEASALDAVYERPAEAQVFAILALAAAIDRLAASHERREDRESGFRR